MDKTRIEWADASWNPVTGCLRGCEYCYAQRIARRFGGHTDVLYSYEHKDEYGKLLHELDKPLIREKQKAPYPFCFEPTLHRYRLDIPKRWERSRTIFVCSMADLFGDWVPLQWIFQVFQACMDAPWHRYLFLTKNTDRYAELDYIGKLPYLEYFWYGTSVTSDRSKIPYPGMFGSLINTFWSIEPLLGPVTMSKAKGIPGWVIIGAETGNRKYKVVPKKEWIDDILKFCGAHEIPVFMKDSLIPIVGEDNMRRDFPWDKAKSTSKLRRELGI